MSQDNICKGCYLRDSCNEVYQKVDGLNCPHFILKIIAAFILPTVVFIISLAVFERFFAREIFLNNSEKLQTFIGFLMALLTTVVFMLILRLINRLLRNFLRTYKT